MANGDIVKLGSFYLNGVKQVRPTLPYNGTPNGASAAGNVPGYSSGNIEIRNTESDDASKMQWISVQDGDKQLLIADRCYLRSVSWDQLNAQNLVFGKEVIIDGVKYLLRLLTGGSSYRTGTDHYSGGQPTNNEWDRIVVNEGAFSGLPTPTSSDLDSTQNATDINGVHNQKWNWYYMYSWCQETYASNSAIRAFRGFSSARYWGGNTASNVGAACGWRPCLEVLKSAPLISDSDRNLGSLTAAPTVSYTVAEGDGEIFSILEALDGTTIRSLTNQLDGTFTVDLASRWGSLSNGVHTLTINATNVVGTTTRTFTFTKTNTPPPAPSVKSPVANQRVPASGYVTFTTGTDADGNAQTVKLQIAKDAAFSSGLVEFSTGLQKYSGSVWSNVSNITNSDAGSQFRLPFSGLALNSQMYIRVVTSDGSASTNSASVKVSVGDVLEFMTLPEQREVQPNTVMVLMDCLIDNKATIQVSVCNNALDATPTWEDCTSEYLTGRTHTFTNAVKTNANWALAVHVTVTANDATGVIEVSSVGMGVN